MDGLSFLLFVTIPQHKSGPPCTAGLSPSCSSLLQSERPSSSRLMLVAASEVEILSSRCLFLNAGSATAINSRLTKPPAFSLLCDLEKVFFFQALAGGSALRQIEFRTATLSQARHAYAFQQYENKATSVNMRLTSDRRRRPTVLPYAAQACQDG